MNGSFSFLKDNTRSFSFEATIDMRLTRLDNDMARLYFVEKDSTNATEQQIPVPTSVQVQNIETKAPATRCVLVCLYEITRNLMYLVEQAGSRHPHIVDEQLRGET